MKKNILLVSLLWLAFATSTLHAQDFSENAKAEMAKNNFRPAIDELTVFLQTNPNSETLLTYRSNFYAKAGENEKAINDANKIITINPRSTNALIILGKAKLGLGKTQEGIENLNQALAIQPNIEPALILRSRAYFKLGQPEKALADLSAVIKNDSRNLEAYVYRGQLFTAMEQFDAAKADYQFILKNAAAGDKYHSAATQKMTELQQAVTAKAKKSEDDAYAKKIADQASSMTKEVSEMTARVSTMMSGYNAEINRFITKSDAIPKTDWQGKTHLYKEINPRIKEYVTNINKERAKIAGNELFKNVVTDIDATLSALNMISDLTSPYAARRQQYVAEANEYDTQINTHFKQMLASQKSLNETEFERHKLLALSKTKNLLIMANEAREELRKLDEAQYRKQDETKMAGVLADYTKMLAAINALLY